MRAILCQEFASPQGLAVSEIEPPQPAAGEIRLRVLAAGLGYADAITVAGLYQVKPPLPFIPGNEICGEVESLGEGVTQPAVGQRVLASRGNGGLAELTCLRAADCRPVPDTLSDEAAAGFVTNYATAYHGLVTRGAVQSGETVLVLGASGGVGMAAIDVAKVQGARVIAAASTEEKRARCRDAGADEVLDYSDDDWRNALRPLIKESGLQVVYDPVGDRWAEPALRSLSPGGRFLVVGFAGGDIPRMPLNLALLKQCAIIGVNWGGHLMTNPADSPRVLEILLDWAAAGRIRPTAGRVYSLDDAGTAMMDMLERRAIGKVVIRP